MLMLMSFILGSLNESFRPQPSSSRAQQLRLQSTRSFGEYLEGHVKERMHLRCLTGHIGALIIRTGLWAKKYRCFLIPLYYAPLRVAARGERTEVAWLISEAPLRATVLHASGAGSLPQAASRHPSRQSEGT